MPSGAQFPIPPFQWPHVGSQWPTWNIESDQAEGLVLWMPWGGGTVPGGHSYVDRISGLVFTKSGSPIWVADSERGWSLLFDDGNNEHLLTNTPAVSSTPLTMACWFNSDSIAVSQTLMSIELNTTTHYHQLWARGLVAGDPVDAWTHGVGGGVKARTTTGYSANTWHHACGVWASSTDRRAFIDAGSKGTNATDRAPLAPDKTRISTSLAGAGMSGYISDARFYNVAKTDAEVEKLVNKETRWELFEIPRHIWRLGVVAPPPSAIVPIAMRHYRSMRVYYAMA